MVKYWNQIDYVLCSQRWRSSLQLVKTGADFSSGCVPKFPCDPMNCISPGFLSMGFSRLEYWSGLPCPPPRDLPDPGIKLASLMSNLHWQSESLPLMPLGCSDHDLLIAKFRLKLKKVGKAIRPFTYDLSNPLWLYNGGDSFEGLDLVDRMLEELQRFTTLYRRQWPKPSGKKRNARRQSGCVRKLYK